MNPFADNPYQPPVQAEFADRPSPARNQERWSIGEGLAYVVWRVAIAFLLTVAALIAMIGGGFGIGHWEFLTVAVICFLWVISAMCKAFKRTL
jgi:hypothetical protein